MVRRLALAAGAAALLVSLASCQLLAFLLSTPFPSTLGLVTASRDLSGQIPAVAGLSFKLAVLETSAGRSFVVLSSRRPSSGATAVIMDAGLSVLKILTYADLGGNAYDGSGAMIDALDAIRIGNRAFDPATLADTTVSSLPKVESYTERNTSHQGFLVPGPSNVTMVGLDSSTGTFNYSLWDSGWTTQSSKSVQVASSPTGSYYLNSLFADPGPAGNVVLVIRESGSGGNDYDRVSHIVTVPKADLAAGPPVLLPLLDYPQSSRQGMDSQAFGYTDGSLFGYDVYGGGYVRLDLQTAEATAGLYCPEATRDTQYAYQPSGGSFYTFDPGTRRVTRYAAWW